MAEIDHIPGEHIPQGVIPQKRVGQYSFLIRSYAIYKGQGKTLDGTSSFFCRTWILSFCAQNKWLVSGGRLGRDYISVNVYCDDRLYGIGSPGGNYVLYAGGS